MVVLYCFSKLPIQARTMNGKSVLAKNLIKIYMQKMNVIIWDPTREYQAIPLFANAKNIEIYTMGINCSYEDFDKIYKAELKRKSIFRYFAFFSVLIACLGLFGLASFTAQRRTKEMGIRKVVGASVWQLVYLLFKEFGKWVLVANVVAWPVAYFAVNDWLNNFAYRTQITAVFFIGALITSLAIGLMTVIYKAIWAASANPVEALKHE